AIVGDQTVAERDERCVTHFVRLSIANDAARCVPLGDCYIRIISCVGGQCGNRTNIDETRVIPQVFIERRSAFDLCGRTFRSKREFRDDVLIAQLCPAFHVLGEKPVEAIAKQLNRCWSVHQRSCTRAKLPRAISVFTAYPPPASMIATTPSLTEKPFTPLPMDVTRPATS